VSQTLGRSFVRRTDYPGSKAIDAALDEAKQALPPATSAYKPAGRTTAAASLLLVASAPVVLVLLAAVCGGLCLAFDALSSSLLANWGHSSHSSSRLMRSLGIFSLVLDFVLALLMIWLPMKLFSAISITFKNRNPVLPAVMAGIVNLVVAVILFVPIWEGDTLAPTDLAILFIPVRWLMIVVGGLGVPLLSAMAVHGTISDQKFCEETGHYLRRMRHVKLPFDSAENALALLRRGEYGAAIRLRHADAADVSLNHWAGLSLWAHEKATTAFLELELHFRGRFKPQSKLSFEEAKDKSAEWLAFSVQLPSAQAIALRVEM
jgi:hypothetical protein